MGCGKPSRGGGGGGGGGGHRLMHKFAANITWSRPSPRGHFLTVDQTRGHEYINTLSSDWLKIM